MQKKIAGRTQCTCVKHVRKSWRCALDNAADVPQKMFIVIHVAQYQSNVFVITGLLTVNSLFLWVCMLHNVCCKVICIQIINIIWRF